MEDMEGSSAMLVIHLKCMKGRRTGNINLENL